MRHDEFERLKQVFDAYDELTEMMRASPGENGDEVKECFISLRR